MKYFSYFTYPSDIIDIINNKNVNINLFTNEILMYRSLLFPIMNNIFIAEFNDINQSEVIICNNLLKILQELNIQDVPYLTTKLNLKPTKIYKINSNCILDLIESLGVLRHSLTDEQINTYFTLNKKLIWDIKDDFIDDVTKHELLNYKYDL